MKRALVLLAGFAATAAALLAGFEAAAQDGTLKKIKDSGSITIGHRDASIPFSYYDDRQQPVGYAVDLCIRIVDAVKGEHRSTANAQVDGVAHRLLPVVVVGERDRGVDLCIRIVDAVKSELKMPNLKVNYQLVTSANRIPLMANGTIDLECGSTTNNLERQKQVWFTITHFVTANRWVAKRDRKSTRLNSSHRCISYAVFCL